VLLQCLNAVSNRGLAALPLKASSFSNADGSGQEKYSFKMLLAISRIFSMYRQLNNPDKYLNDWRNNEYETCRSRREWQFINNYSLIRFSQSVNL